MTNPRPAHAPEAPQFGRAEPVVADSRRLPLPLEWVSRIVDLAVIMIGASLITIVLINVVLHLLAHDLAWVTELGEFMMVWVTFLGGVAAARRNVHMSITELLDKLPPARRRWADAAVQTFCLTVLALLLFYGWRMVESSWGSVLTTLDWPMAWQYMPLPLSSALMILFIGYDLILILRGIPRDQRYQEN
ncbi:MAG: TRAP transporter small permease [Bosea sp.]|jgi:TRAP-type C4-dicarboxylate transport system permease small subunit|uniref:TRAP transporter small permease n=1 Tax=Hyphomicrobiales TaxID=356 RepID=UPI0009EBEC85|nr:MULTISPECIES: TRAP transporter small permease [Hyphomicrobiales]MCP4561737.1 TRAP transporter small permease [Bosea sp. (in: a-proteobacteria)]MCP4736928.1 TRAP transporter small permease [Bosea sp. (in: a-proteobacteria)]MDX3805043.1 TRAP transporter small permease [Bosea sp. (in: a-proteobacteria)]